MELQYLRPHAFRYNKFWLIFTRRLLYYIEQLTHDFRTDYSVPYEIGGVRG